MAVPVAPPPIDLPRRLWLALDSAHISVKQMAEHLGVTDGTIRNYLKGRTTPTRSTLMAWAMICEVPFEWLDEGERRTGWLVAA